MSKWLYRISTGLIITGGTFEPSLPIVGVANNVTTYDPDFAIVEFAGNVAVDLKTQRFDGTKLRPATQAELDSVVLADKDRTAMSQVDEAAVKATVAWVLFKLLGRLPTAPELATARSQWITAFKQFIN